MALTTNDISGVKGINVSLSTDLFYRLRDDIVLSALDPGQKLTEQEICNKYQVSRTPVREALRQLESEGLIETIPNRGAFVLGFTKQDLRDMYVLRGIYEVQAVRWACERMTDEEFETLQETFEFMEFYTMKNDLEKMLNINTNFHQVIYSATHNKKIAHLLSTYQIYIKLGNKNPKLSTPTVTDKQYLDDVLEEHRAIFEALKDRDEERAAAAMQRHMDSSFARHY